MQNVVNLRQIGDERFWEIAQKFSTADILGKGVTGKARSVIWIWLEIFDDLMFFLMTQRQNPLYSQKQVSKEYTYGANTFMRSLASRFC